jgi:hypothetical protein
MLSSGVSLIVSGRCRAPRCNACIHSQTHVELYLSYFLPQLVTGIKMVTFPLWKPLVASTLKVSGHAKDMEAFYKYQKEGYDSFREGLLHARPALMEAFPLKKGGGMVWIDIGGGTARNLEFFSVRYLLVLRGWDLLCGRCVVLRVTVLIYPNRSDWWIVHQ